MDKNKIAVAVFDKLAHQYQDKFMNVELYHDSFDLFCDSIETENARILEIACGPGNITQYLLKKRPGFNILGIDLAPNMIALAKANNPTAEFQVMDARDIGRINQQFDAVMCGFCLPYLSEEQSVELIKDAAGLLIPNGIFYISTMEADETHRSGIRKSSSGDEIYMYYHQTDYLTDALRKYGFKIEKVIRQDYPEQDGTKTTDLIIIARKTPTWKGLNPNNPA